MRAVLLMKLEVKHACIHQQMFLHVSSSFNPKFETCPGQHGSLETQFQGGKGDRMIGMGVFTVNKNKGWQAGWLLHRNAPCSHLHSLALSTAEKPTRQGIVTLTYSMCELSTGCLHMTRLTTTVCGSLLNIQCTFNWEGREELGE